MTPKPSKNDQISDAETAKLLSLASTCLDLDGDFVEFGCYRGDTSVLLAKLLANTQPHFASAQPHPTPNSISLPPATTSVPTPSTSPKRLWAYDSFSGLPAKSPEDLSSAGANFQAGALHVSKRALIDKLKRHSLHNVIIKKAWFSDLTPNDLPDQISFAFLDGDFYTSQTTALNLVVSRLAEQGIIVCHDYHNPELPGATRAVDDFLSTHPSFHLSIFHTLAILH